MILYIAANRDGSEIISKLPLKRFIDYETNREDVLSYKDSISPNHWIVDYKAAGVNIPKTGHIPADEYITIPSIIISKFLGRDITWDDEPIEIEV